ESVRPQPMHSPERGSMVQTLVQGVCMTGGASRILSDHNGSRGQGNRAGVATHRAHVPTRNSGRRTLRLSSTGAIGAIGGDCSAIGAMAATTRSGGKVQITSVPMRSFDFSTKVPP